MAQQEIARSALRFSLGTLFSRISGMAREVSTACFFGTHPAIAAFFVAYRLAHVMRRLLGEGALLVGFVPVYEAQKKESPEKAALFFRDLFITLTLFLLLFIGLSEIVLYFFWDGSHEVLFLTMLTLPGLLFICLAALFSSLLQCEKRFFLTGVAPLIFNLTWIATVFFYRKEVPEVAAWGLAIGTVIAVLMQWLFLIPTSFKEVLKGITYQQWLKPRFFSSELKTMLHSISLGVIGLGAAQINGFLDALIARAASLEGPAYLTYAIRIQQLPLALFGIAIAAASLPTLSRTLKAGNLEQFKSLMQFGLQRILLLLLPCSVAIFVIGFSAVNLLYGRGHFSNEATMHTTTCLWGYGWGLVPMCFALMLAQGFYAFQDFKTPMWGALLSVFVNVVLNLLFVFIFNWSSQSIAIATSLSSLVQAAYLFNRLSKKIGKIEVSLFRVTWIALLSAICTLILGNFLFHEPTISFLMGGEVYLSRNFLDQCLHFGTLSVSFIALFFIFAKIFRVTDVLQLLRRVRSS